MRAVIQRVAGCTVRVGGEPVGAIGPGLLVLLGVEDGDAVADCSWLAGKIARLRIFADAAGLMNQDVVQAGGGVLVVSQFTLLADTAKGNRPAFVRAARPEQAVPLYQGVVDELVRLTGRAVPTGRFGADMQVELVNDGPVTIVIDSRRRE